MRADNGLKQYSLSNIDTLKVHGRTTGELSPLTLFWTGSGIELNVNGSELWIEVESGYDIYEPWISIVINSVPISRQMLYSGKYWICVFRGMNANVVKNVRIIKESQAMSDDNGCYLQIHTVKSDGEFLPIAEKSLKIEFIGDSITSGEGAIGAKTEEDWIPMWFSAIDNYSYMTADAFNADYRCISQSGWGVLTSWDNNPRNNIPDCYEKVCGLLKGDSNKALGALEDNDFEAWQPDVIVINLGTNDESAFNSPAWRDELTGETHKQRRNEDGTFNAEDIRAFINTSANFLMKLRKYNKASHIIWAYGMLGNQMMPAIKKAVDLYVKKTGDNRISVVKLPDTTEETVGARSHPGVLAHKLAANVLCEYIKGLIETLMV